MILKHAFKKGRLLLVFLALFLIVCIMCVFGPKRNDGVHSKISSGRRPENVKFQSVPNIEHPNKEGWKKILLWTPYFRSMKDWKKIFRRHLNNECPESRCIYYTSKKNVKQADAVLFSSYDMVEKNYSMNIEPTGIPRYRTKEQIYIFFSAEPPPTLNGIDFEKYDNFFNWTLTYRKDSDVYAPFGRFNKISIKGLNNTFKPLTGEELTKKLLVIWMVSHCGAFSKRDQFVKRLRSYVNVDQFGSCGYMRCGQRYILPFIKHGEVDPCDKLTKGFVFFLALENALCKDYVTEKMFRSMQMGVIPVVMGGSFNYSTFAPPNSYIDVKDFKSVQDLATYMIKVSQDAKLYNSYFKWKDEYESELGDPFKPFICGLCEKLHSTDVTSMSKTYKSIKEWFVDDSECHYWEEETTEEEEVKINARNDDKVGK